MDDLKCRSEHFEFGANWLDFAGFVDERRIALAVQSLQSLFPDDELRGATFLDIGCGSGLSLLAAFRLGARKVVGLDIDENSVEAARKLLKQFVPNDAWHVYRASIFDVQPPEIGRFDVVHSWGVLHHTGAMWEAVRRTAGLVGEGGYLAIALYHKTPYCGMWRFTKRWYSRMPSIIQMPWRWLYQAAVIARVLAGRGNPIAYIKEYSTNRGMSWRHDVHDWLGGYPYESAAPDDVWEALQAANLVRVRDRLPKQSRWFRGLLGSTCDEFVARRLHSKPARSKPAPGIASTEG